MNFEYPDGQQRTAILYVRITEENKNFIEDLADDYEISTSNFINNILNQVREQRQRQIYAEQEKTNDRKKIHIPKGTKEASKR
jgi:Mor family transcriptional regulator